MDTNDTEMLAIFMASQWVVSCMRDGFTPSDALICTQVEGCSAALQITAKAWGERPMDQKKTEPKSC